MKRALIHKEIKLEGQHPGLVGKPSEYLFGEVSPFLHGTLHPKLFGEISPKLVGNITGVYGPVTWLEGNLDECDLTEDDRRIGVHTVKLCRTNIG